MEVLATDLVAAQIEAVISDMPPSAAKTGALGTSAIVDAVANQLRDAKLPLVVDPVMISKHGLPLIAEEGKIVVVAIRSKVLGTDFKEGSEAIRKVREVVDLRLASSERGISYELAVVHRYRKRDQARPPHFMPLFDDEIVLALPGGAKRSNAPARAATADPVAASS